MRDGRGILDILIRVISPLDIAFSIIRESNSVTSMNMYGEGDSV